VPGTQAKSTSFAALGKVTWIDAWQAWMQKLNDDLATASSPPAGAQ
jgi:hypothetical protein